MQRVIVAPQGVSCALEPHGPVSVPLHQRHILSNLCTGDTLASQGEILRIHFYFSLICTVTESDDVPRVYFPRLHFVYIELWFY